MKKYRLSTLLGVGLLKDARFATAAIVGVLLLGGSAANAAIMDFDGFTGNNVGYWEQNDFLFNPAKSNNDTKCYDNKCLMEIGQGVVTTMTHDADGEPKPLDLSGFLPGSGPGNKLTEDERDEALATVYNDVFNLDFFYFLLVGNGDDQENSFKVTGTYEDASRSADGMVSAEFVLGDDIISTFATGADVSFAKAATGSCDDTTATIDKNCGYWVDLDDTLWNALTSVTWAANTFDGNGKQVLSAQMRLDCVGANEDNPGENHGCDPTDIPIPLPATAWLLLGGLVTLGAAVRRRKDKDGIMV
jgi:hypothetical protein